MILFERYIARHVFGSVLAVFILFTSLVGMFTFIVELGNLTEKYTFTKALWFVFMETPWVMVQVLPISVMMGSIIGLGILSGSGELIVMQVSGISKLKICWNTIKPVLILILASLILDLTVLPKIRYDLDQYRHENRYGNKKINYNKGLWHKHKENITHIGVINQNTLEDIDVFVFNKKNMLIKTIHATSASIQNNEWFFYSGNEMYFYGDKFIRKEFKKVKSHINFDINLLKMSILPADSLSIYDLFRNIKYQKQQKLDTRQYYIILYQRLFQPITTIALLLMAVSFIFGPLRYVAMGQRIFVGATAGILVMLIQNLAAPIAVVFNIPVLIAFFTPVLLILTFSFWLLR